MAAEKKKRVLVACGTGICTSTTVLNKIEGALEKRGLGGRIDYQTGTVAEMPSKAHAFDLVITTVRNNHKLDTHVILGVAFLIGRGTEPILQEIIDYLGLEK